MKILEKKGPLDEKSCQKMIKNGPKIPDFDPISGKMSSVHGFSVTLHYWKSSIFGRNRSPRWKFLKKRSPRWKFLKKCSKKVLEIEISEKVIKKDRLGTQIEKKCSKKVPEMKILEKKGPRDEKSCQKNDQKWSQNLKWHKSNTIIKHPHPISKL